MKTADTKRMKALIEKYSTSAPVKEEGKRWDWKECIIPAKGKKEDISGNIDSIVYGV